MSREILARLYAARVGIASATYEITVLPALTDKQNGRVA